MSETRSYLITFQLTECPKMTNGEGRNISDACYRGCTPGSPLRARTRRSAPLRNATSGYRSVMVSLRGRIRPTPLTWGCPALLFTGTEFLIEA